MGGSDRWEQPNVQDGDPVFLPNPSPNPYHPAPSTAGDRSNVDGPTPDPSAETHGWSRMSVVAGWKPSGSSATSPEKPSKKEDTDRPQCGPSDAPGHGQSMEQGV
eukprot:scaffold1673_cov330-Pavlova_lutheri.AAC.5